MRPSIQRSCASAPTHSELSAPKGGVDSLTSLFGSVRGHSEQEREEAAACGRAAVGYGRTRAVRPGMAFAYTRGVPDRPRCPHCGAPVEKAETTEVASSTRGGFRLILVACPSSRAIGVGGSVLER
jgi:hypothetical protein